MNSPLLDIDSYWQALSASNPAVQTVEGAGTSPQFDEVAPKSPMLQSRGPRFDNNI